MELGGLSALNNIGQALSDRKSIADNFDTFLQLLTTQLQNQNPLDPLDTNEFTNQLVQFSTVEQNVKTNTHLESLLKLSSASVSTAAVSYIGKLVTAEGATAPLKDGNAQWTFSLDKNAPDSSVVIRDASGEVVFSQDAELTAGTHGYTWDGRDANGNIRPDGDYTIQFIAKDSNGLTVDVESSVGGIIDRVDLSAADPILISGDKRIPLSTVRFIGQAAP